MGSNEARGDSREVLCEGPVGKNRRKATLGTYNDPQRVNMDMFRVQTSDGDIVCVEAEHIHDALNKVMPDWKWGFQLFNIIERCWVFSGGDNSNGEKWAKVWEVLDSGFGGRLEDLLLEED